MIASRDNSLVARQLDTHHGRARPASCIDFERRRARGDTSYEGPSAGAPQGLTPSLALFSPLTTRGHWLLRVQERGKDSPIDVSTSLELPAAEYKTVDHLRSAMLTLQEETTGAFTSAAAGATSPQISHLLPPSPTPSHLPSHSHRRRQGACCSIYQARPTTGRFQTTCGSTRRHTAAPSGICSTPTCRRPSRGPSPTRLALGV